jgi:hypothetical protein
VSGWAKGANHSVKYMETNQHRYMHEFCMPRAGDDQLPLF